MHWSILWSQFGRLRKGISLGDDKESLTLRIESITSMHVWPAAKKKIPLGNMLLHKIAQGSWQKWNDVPKKEWYFNNALSTGLPNQ